MATGSNLIFYFWDNKCIEKGGEQEVKFPAYPSEKRKNSNILSDTCAVIRVDSDVVSAEDQPAIAVVENSESLISFDIRFAGNHNKESERIAQTILCFMNSYQKENAQYEFSTTGDLVACMVFSQGVLAQLLAAETDEESSARTPSDNDDKTHLHYVCKEKLTEAYVDGTAVRAVCGVWFVPTLSDSANLPICCNCEQKKAAAQIIFDLTHRRFS